MAQGTSTSSVKALSAVEVVSSDESDAGESSKSQSQAEYYNEKLDDKDEAWAIERRQGRKSDAILSCPACFTTLCIDCQRHEQYVQQYRAMFVSNCRIMENERLKMPSHRQTRKNQRRKKRAAANVEADSEHTLPETESEDDILKPVRCSVCETEVAIIDKDEVYHFFNIVPSYS